MALISEYQQQYVRRKDDIVEAAYTDRLRLRKARKTCEMGHTPLVWIDNISNSNSCKAQVGCEEKLSRSPKNMISVPLIQDDTKETLKTHENIDVATQTPSKTPLRRSKRKSASLVDLHHDSPKKSLLCNDYSKQKPKAAFKNHERPIIQYGWNDQSSIVAKKTFNINAPPGEVKPSALSFAKFRDKKKMGLTKEEKIKMEKKKNKTIIDSLTDFDQWQTEYQKQFNKKS